MTVQDIIALIEAGDTVIAKAISSYRDVRATLSDTDRAAVEQRLAQIAARNETDFARVDGELIAAEQG